MKHVISAEGLSKKYELTHISRESYYTLRDAIMARGKALANKVLHGTSRQGQATGSTTEEFWALDNVSFNVPEGARVGIIGRNGAGKSTLLKILSRITDPTRGQVRVRGRIASILEVGTGFHPELTGRENIFLNGALMGMKRAEIKSKFDAIVDFSGVERFLDTPVKRYSSGMYVRLAFSVAAHLDPDILLVDEVLAVGDLEFQKKCIEKMSQVTRDGKTILFVSHNLSVIASFCDMGIVLEGGRVVTIAPVNDALGEYKKLINTTREGDLIGLRPTGPLRLVSIKPVDKNENPVEFVRSGEQADFIIDVENTGEKPGAAIIHYALHNEDNVRLFYCGTHLSGKEFHVNPGRNRFKLEIPRLPLPGGAYRHFMLIFFNGAESHRSPDCGELMVAPGGFFALAADPPSKLGLMLVDHNWKQ